MDAPQPDNEFERLIELSELDLDYSSLEDHLEDLTKLAAQIVGTKVFKNEQINEALEYVEMIEKGGKSLLELVEEIMDREDSEEKEKPDENQFNCSGFCQKLNELYQPQAKSKGVELNIHTSEESDDMLFSKSKLLQIVGNLITNSIKFTEEEGKIEVEINVTETDDEINSNELEIKVEDTGVGMEQGKVEEILEGAAQSESGTGGEKGYGFGLTLVHYLVTKADGEMEIESGLGEGTTFKICLPV